MFFEDGERRIGECETIDKRHVFFVMQFLSHIIPFIVLIEWKMKSTHPWKNKQLK